jgi:hypothetical protein
MLAADTLGWAPRFKVEHPRWCRDHFWLHRCGRNKFQLWQGCALDVRTMAVIIASCCGSFTKVDSSYNSGVPAAQC